MVVRDSRVEVYFHAMSDFKAVLRLWKDTPLWLILENNLDLTTDICQYTFLQHKNLTTEKLDSQKSDHRKTGFKVVFLLEICTNGEWKGRD